MAFSVGGDVNRDVTITFIGRDQASSAMRSISSSATKTTSTASRLAGVLKKVAAVAATALAAAAVIGAKAIWDFTKAAYADQVAMQKLAFIQRKAQDATDAQVKSTQKLIDKLELATGIADDEMRPALSALASTGMSVAKSQDLLQVAMDVSVARGKSLQSVAEALTKGYNGQITGLTRLGIKTTDASGDTLKFAQVVDLLKDKFNGAAKAAGKTDPIKRLTAAWNQTKEALGKGFLPLLKQFSNWMINTGVPWIKQKLVPAIKEFADWIKRNKDGISGFMDVLQGAWKILTAVWKVLATLARWLSNAYSWFKKLFGVDTSFLDDVHDGLVFLKQPLTFIKAAVYALRDAFNSLMTAIGGAWEKLIGLVNTFANLPTGAIGFIHDHVPGLAAGGQVKHRAMGGTIVGEHGPELLSNGWVKSHSQTMGMSGGPNIVVNINGVTDKHGAAREVQKVLLDYKRSLGGGALGLA